MGTRLVEYCFHLAYNYWLFPDNRISIQIQGGHQKYGHSKKLLRPRKQGFKFSTKYSSIKSLPLYITFSSLFMGLSARRNISCRVNSQKNSLTVRLMGLQMTFFLSGHHFLLSSLCAWIYSLCRPELSYQASQPPEETTGLFCHFIANPLPTKKEFLVASCSPPPLKISNTDKSRK